MRGQPHVLYIENSEHNRRLVNRILEPAGFSVSFAYDGLKGIEKAIDLKPDLILMDLNLPQFDGLGAAAKIKSVSSLSSVPLVALSSKNNRTERERAIVAGCDGFISKPIDVGSFPEQIRTYLEGKREEVAIADQSNLLKAFNLNLVDQLKSKVEELERANRELKTNASELRNAYEQSQQWNLERERLNRLKENIVAITSHELRTPLSVAMGYLDLILEETFGTLDSQQIEVLSIARQNLRKMGELVGRITDLTRLTIKKFPMKIKEIDFHESLNSVMQEVSFFMKIRRLKFSADLCDQPLPVMADWDMLSQVFSNLLRNAICYTPDGGTITLKTNISRDKVYFAIVDSGIGISEEDLPRIFDGFYQVQDHTHHRTGQFEFMSRGIGVGLALCKGILDELGGRIWAESPGPNLGSTFTFYLPLVNQS